MSSKPQTLGYALNDSRIGQAAWTLRGARGPVLYLDEVRAFFGNLR